MKKTLTKKFYILTSISSVLVVGVMVAFGVIVGQEVFDRGVDYSQIDQGNLEDDNEALMRRFDKANPSNYLTSFKPYELVNIALNKVGGHKNVTSITSGEVNAAGVTQTINGICIKDDMNYFSENISSSSLVKTTWRFYQDEEGVTTYNGSQKTPRSASWNESSKVSYTLEEFEESWGKTFARPSIYVLSKKTVISESIKQEGETYVCSIDLDPTLSVVRYVKQMMMTSKLKKAPTFHSVHIDFTLDSSLNLLKDEINESYDVVMFGKHTSVGKLSDTFTYDLEKNIPQLNEDSPY